MTKNMHLRTTKNPHFINARGSGMSKTQMCCYRYIWNLCETFSFCKDCDPEFKAKLQEELKEEKEIQDKRRAKTELEELK